MQIRDVLKKKTEIIIAISVSIIGDVIPVILIMAGLWTVKYFSRLFGFEELPVIQLLMVFEEVFMVIIYLALVVESIIVIYKLFKEGEL